MSLVLVVADSVRADAPGCLGGQARTPTLDNLAAEGALFERVITAAPWTVPSIAAMLTGVYAHRLGLAKWEQPWPAVHPSLFDEAERAGLEVASFVFDPQFLFRNVPAARVAGSSQDEEQVFSWLRARRGRPFFLFVHYYFTHVPYVATPMTLEAWRKVTDRVLEAMRSGQAARAGARRLYLHAVERLSESFLRRLLDEVDLASCWVVVTSDHGESWGERSGTEGIRDVFDLHGRSLHGEALRVPLVVRPAGGSPGVRIDRLARTVDLAPTLADLLGIELGPHWRDADGVSLSRWVRGEITAQGPSDAVSAASRDFLDAKDLPQSPRELLSGLALTTEPHKLIWDIARNERHAYDLLADPAEGADLGAGPGEELASGWARLEAELDRAQVGPLVPEDVEAVRERLRRLGYTD